MPIAGLGGPPCGWSKLEREDVVERVRLIGERQDRLERLQEETGKKLDLILETLKIERKGE